jgi:Fe-S-cluster containining protein
LHLEPAFRYHPVESFTSLIEPGKQTLIDQQMTFLQIDEPFQFACSPEVPCFNACCRDLNQFLTPYDVLRLKNSLGLSSSQFLQKYTICRTGPESGLPVVTLKPQTGPERRCPFVTSEGCRVYEDRPASCRTYPLARLARRARDTGRITEQFVLLREDHCRGFDQRQTQTVRQWFTRQGADVYNQINDWFLEILSLKNQFKPQPLDSRETRLFTMALYDLDHFKIQLKNRHLPENAAMAVEAVEEALSDDIALLKLGHRWIKQVLFA